MTTTAGRWTKLYGSLIDGDALAMSRDARLLGVEAEAWSDDQETDGRIPRNALRRITDAEDPATLVAELVSTGRWVESDEGWTVVGFLDRHDAADARAAARADDAARIKGWRAHRDGKHNADGPKSCDRCNGVRNGVTNAVRTEVEATRREAKRSDAVASGKDGAGSAPYAGAAVASPAPDGRGKKWTPEQRARASERQREAHARKRIEREAAQAAWAEANARALEEQRAREAAAQQARDDEWLRLGGSPDALPVSADRLWRRKNPGRRPLR